MRALVLVLCSLMGCESDPGATAPTEPAAATNAAEAPALTEETKALTRNEFLAPSPEETRRAVSKAGLTTSLGSLVPAREFAFEGLTKDQAALRAGVCLSDTILTIQESENEALLDQLGAFRAGLQVMGSGAGLLNTLKDLEVGVENGAISRDGLLEELDGIVSMFVPEQGFAAGDRTGPLLQAGAWTAGVNLTAQAILKEDRVELASELLRLQAVADYFLEYVEGEGQEKAGELVLTVLRTTLLALKEIAEKETLERTDVEEVVRLTGHLLGLI